MGGWLSYDGLKTHRMRDSNSPPGLKMSGLFLALWKLGCKMSTLTYTTSGKLDGTLTLQPIFQVGTSGAEILKHLSFVERNF